MAVDICAACGYPTVGPELCFYCRPAAARADDRWFDPVFSAPSLPIWSTPARLEHPGAHPAA